MLLVDTSVWIDHFHATDDTLLQLLANDEVGCHSSVIAELALGSLARRGEVISLLLNLRQFPDIHPGELLAFVEARRLWGRGLSAVDAHLLASVLLVPGASLWTRDKRLAAAAAELGIDAF